MAALAEWVEDTMTYISQGPSMETYCKILALIIIYRLMSSLKEAKLGQCLITSISRIRSRTFSINTNMENMVA